MANLLATMLSTARALSAYDQVLEVSQNNVANAATPGFVKQRQSLTARPFEPTLGLGGGVRAGEVQSSRNAYAEQAVRRQNLLLGEAHQKVNSLSAIQHLFDISASSGIPDALNNLYQSFSAWGQSANDAVARRTVIERAGDLARSFQSAATGLTNVAVDAERQIGQTVDEVNRLVGQIRDFNVQIMAGSRNDAGLDAQLHSTMEELSQYVEFTALKQDDGSYSVLMNGQTPLVVGEREYGVSAKPVAQSEPPPAYPDARPPVHVFASDGADITAASTGGQLGALLDVRNRLLAKYLGDAGQAGELNTMAKRFAGRVNEVLTSGVAVDSDPPVQGAALFAYDTTNDTSVARTLTVVDGVTPSSLGAISMGPPRVANGIPLALSAMADPQQDADTIDGASFTEYYGLMAARVGHELNRASDEKQIQQSAVAQAKDLRGQMSGVSLDEEAIILIQFQRAYEANSRFLSVLNQLTGDMINILQA